MSFSGGLFLTNAGRIALSKIQADSSKSLNFSKFAFGDGQLNGSLEIERTALINQKDTQPITRLRVNGDNTVTVGTKRPGNAVGGYYLREIGIFATDPDNNNAEILYGYANAGDDAQYLPTAESAEIVEKTVNVIISITNGTVVTATVSTGTAVTPEEFAAHVDDTDNPHEVSAQQVGAALENHTHGNITNDGKIGTLANKAVYTGAGGALQAGTLPVAAGGTGGTTAAAARAGIGAQAARLTFTSKSVATSAWLPNATYTDFPYRAAVSCDGVDAAMFAEVVFSPTDATSGNYAPICTTASGVVYLYAKEEPDADLTIPAIIVWG
uniref:Tail-collar fiber protein n=1 Tax=Siphoviridae sp. ct3lF2 TaxID=2825324 RepID=A0A8S5PQ90_9CAUD|nr:MAG TPA: tail-collar fiber protein [Siphoviridae sp. ct3lF2]